MPSGIGHRREIAVIGRADPALARRIGPKFAGANVAGERIGRGLRRVGLETVAVGSRNIGDRTRDRSPPARRSHVREIGLMLSTKVIRSGPARQSADLSQVASPFSLGRNFSTKSAARLSRAVGVKRDARRSRRGRRRRTCRPSPSPIAIGRKQRATDCRRERQQCVAQFDECARQFIGDFRRGHLRGDQPPRLNSTRSVADSMITSATRPEKRSHSRRSSAGWGRACGPDPAAAPASHVCKLADLSGIVAAQVARAVAGIRARAADRAGRVRSRRRRRPAE